MSDNEDDKIDEIIEKHDIKINKKEIENKKIIIKEDEIYYLNIGGEKYTTTYQTLTKEIGKEYGFDTDNYFQKLLLKNFEIDKDKKNEIFIDRDGKVFRYILNFLRDPEQFIFPFDIYEFNLLKREAEYYLLDPLIFLFENLEYYTNNVKIIVPNYNFLYNPNNFGFENIIINDFRKRYPKKFNFIEYKIELESKDMDINNILIKIGNFLIIIRKYIWLSIFK
jgi:hypothetical protein